MGHLCHGYVCGKNSKHSVSLLYWPSKAAYPHSVGNKVCPCSAKAMLANQRIDHAKELEDLSAQHAKEKADLERQLLGSAALQSKIMALEQECQGFGL